MIKDFIYYWREYGFFTAWTNRRLIAINHHELDSVMNHSDYEEDIFGIIEALVEENDLDW
jgi:hypothetical protein